MPSVAVADTTTHAIAPHSALAGVASSHAISSPPAASTSRDTPSSGPAGRVSHSRKYSASSPKMIFSDLYKSTRLPLARLRQQSNQATPSIDYDADLVSKDKAKNKEAVKKYLADRIRNDWEFKWPRADKPTDGNGSKSDGANSEDAKQHDIQESREISSHDLEGRSVEKTEDDGDDDDDDDDTASTYSTVSEDIAHFRPRLEWWSDFSEDEVTVHPSAYRFDTPDAVGPTVQATAHTRQTKIRRAIREEASWNSGLACFNARRDAWTGAKVVRVKPKPSSAPTSPLSASRRMSFFRFASTSPPVSPGAPLSPTTTRTSGDTNAVTSSDGDPKEYPPKADSSQYPVETILPVAHPLLPPANPMRASITPSSYPNLYDRIIVHSLTPSCPVNLADVLKFCVVGWKRDGEWPPRPAEVAPVVAVRKKQRDSVTSQNRRPSTGRRMSLGFLGRRESATGDTPTGTAATEDSGKGIKKSIQRVLGLGHQRTGSNVSNNG
ncbi:hypothetical protein BKA67DRAFT_532066 [Truncatella angustata]|uniref:Gag1-like clamp domain-containing protein n=1 Tax=Truncatella angustata TaxID=152316 RepID=A0A9P8UQX1_9PEZI|nr:uncharacterized protein BKA67DRAFT_532066 [Truncatella angustata]KAH6656817.1 hypothetical protein BKA67DRAFT_532066 [Truncatella angustata]